MCHWNWIYREHFWGEIETLCLSWKFGLDGTLWKGHGTKICGFANTYLHLLFGFWGTRSVGDTGGTRVTGSNRCTGHQDKQTHPNCWSWKLKNSYSASILLQNITLKLSMFNSTYEKVIIPVAIILQVYLKWILKVIQEFIKLS